MAQIGSLPAISAAGAAATPKADRAKAAQAFEAMVIAQMLRAAGTASLGDDLLGSSGGPVRQMVDQMRAELLAGTAPLGIAKLLEARP